MTHKSIVILFFMFAFFGWNRISAEDATLSFYYEIAKQNCHDIASIRVEMDRINNEILELLAERTAYVKRAGDLKSLTNKIADDRKRVADQEKKIINISRDLELPLEISLPAFRVIMETSINFQQGYIDQLGMDNGEELSLADKYSMVANAKK